MKQFVNKESTISCKNGIIDMVIIVRTIMIIKTMMIVLDDNKTDGNNLPNNQQHKKRVK